MASCHNVLNITSFCFLRLCLSTFVCFSSFFPLVAVSVVTAGRDSAQSSLAVGMDGPKKGRASRIKPVEGMSSCIKKSEEEEVKEGMKDSQSKNSLQLRFSACCLDVARLVS